jgi:uncharacterized membrane protein YoaK (UPF0700 family)
MTKHRIIACCFSFVTGYTDVISVTRWHVFATMMTGNVVWMGRTVTPQSGSERRPAFYIAVILAFFAGAVAYRVAEVRWPNRGASLLGLPLGTILMSGEAALLTGLVSPTSRLYYASVLSVVPMFGVLNAACLAGKLATTTTLATGHLVTLSGAAAKVLQREPFSQLERVKLMMSVLVFASIFAGATAGASVYYLSDGVSGSGSHGALLPVGPLLALLFWLHDHLAKPQKLVKKMNRKLRPAAAVTEGDDHSPRERVGTGDSDTGSSDTGSTYDAESEERSPRDLDLECGSSRASLESGVSAKQSTASCGGCNSDSSDLAAKAGAEVAAPAAV